MADGSRRAFGRIAPDEVLRGGDDFIRATVFAPPRNDVRVHIYEKAAANKWTLRELSRVRQTLEDVFRSLTIGDERRNRRIASTPA